MLQEHTLHKKNEFSIKDFFSTFTADLVTFTEEILNGKFYFLCSDSVDYYVSPLELTSRKHPLICI